MPAPVVPVDKRSPSLLTALFWIGVALAPLAALILLIADGDGPLRFGAVLAILAVVLIGLSIALRAEGGGTAGSEELRGEIEQLRRELRGEIVAAAQRGNQALDQAQRSQEAVLALRRRLDVAAAAGDAVPAAEEHAVGGARVPVAYAEPRAHYPDPVAPGRGQHAGRDGDEPTRYPQAAVGYGADRPAAIAGHRADHPQPGVYGSPRPAEPERRPEPRQVGVVHHTETVHVTTRRTIVDGAAESVAGALHGGHAGRWSPAPDERAWRAAEPGERSWGAAEPAERSWGGAEPAGGPWGADPAEGSPAGYREAEDDRFRPSGQRGQSGRDEPAWAAPAGVRDDSAWAAPAGRRDDRAWAGPGGDRDGGTWSGGEPAWSGPGASREAGTWAGERSGAGEQPWTGTADDSTGAGGDRGWSAGHPEDRSWSTGRSADRSWRAGPEERPWAPGGGRERPDPAHDQRGWPGPGEAWAPVDARAPEQTGAVADEADGDYWSALRAGNRWASVREDGYGREVRLGERRAAVRADGAGTEYRMEDRWASVHEPHRGGPADGAPGWAGESRPALPAGGVTVPDEWRPPTQRSGQPEWRQVEPAPARYGGGTYGHPRDDAYR